jgi:murein DD-endopeptidase MepM/ murein hydrolase activator NlpD
LNGAATIGLCGNSGNSEATHLHLEIRASKSEQFTGWAALRQGLMTPGVLFKR